ncbi:MAG TPA: DedA family protein [Smithella sp.]|nr:DedA family protein [Smithella sp.]MDM7987047.1 DedA family protein [Smithella sp.]HNY50115.1 DedA family protein [Smithella sp.]HOG89568.1 DedA family protein [Smithella sp.]HOU49904.1 DedA family protein [Smithella sp.]
MNIESYIIHFGYVVILVATFFAGEAILVLAGFLAHRGYLSFSLVILVAFAGSLTSDQLYYFIGRQKGLAYLDKHPSWKTKSERILRLIEKHQNLVILLFRFIYGVRSITPFLVGVSRVSPLKYFILNAVGALVWALALTSLGYVFGHAAELILDDIKKYEFIMMGIILLAGLGAWMVHFRAREKEKI